MEAQNIYDDPAFFTAYSQMVRSQKGLAGAPEWPTLRDLIGDTIHGAAVLDLGCGYGWFCRWAVHEGGAGSVHGIDISERMLARARELDAASTTTTTGALIGSENDSGTGTSTSTGTGTGTGVKITYEQADLDKVQLPQATFELVYSSLALHYLSDLERLFTAVSSSLKPGGKFVFSVEHPIYSAPVKEEWMVWKPASGEGEGVDTWLLNQYGMEGPRVKNWLGGNVIRYHRTIQTYLRLLVRSGFAVFDLVEWMPEEKDLEAHPEWAREQHRPAFLLIGARKLGES